ncbi:metallophosphoesterase family protein [Janthinobacterium sp. NFX145]|uniref:metallophosphoesterase family protein n=1 Tax=Janthinobacterium sp. NFX145 TaxID=3415602 RepID=UPI003CC5EBEE
MPISHVSFLHLGDVHYPDLILRSQLVDHKDQGLAAATVGAVSSTRIADIARGINRIRAEEKNLVAIVLTGDLTTKGNIAGYKDCLTFLHRTLQLSDVDYWQHRGLLAVPGNHDLDRSLIVNGQPLLDKFSPLSQVWADVCGSASALTVGMPLATDLSPIGVDNPSIRFLPINTCFLCGEFRAFPERIRNEMVKALDTLKSTVPVDVFDKMVSEQIDCPAAERGHVDAIAQYIRECDASSVPVVFGHHPLLAQPMPRIDGYNEMLNAGFVRETILESRKNVIYLHGHIHQDPLLTVNSPMRGAHRIIHISAPALEDGFNLIRIYFSTETGQPLGMELIPHRFGDHLGLVKRDAIKLRLIDQTELWNEIDQPWIEHVLAKLTSPQIVLRFNDLLKSAPNSLKVDLEVSAQVDALTDALIILELLEIIEIVNREKPSKTWQCRRKII